MTRDPAGPRVHRADRRREVRRLLPRPRRLAARGGRLGRRDLRAARQRGGAGVLGRRDDRAALQRPRRRRGRLRGPGSGDRLRHHRGRRRQHGGRPAGRRLHRGAPAHRPRARRARRQRRGDDGVPVLARPGGTGSRVRMRRGHPTCSPSARSWAAGSPRRRSVVAPTSWPCSPRRAGLPGRHALREPGRHGRRAGDAARLHAGGVRPARRGEPRHRGRRGRGAGTRGGPAYRAVGGVDVQRLLP